MHAGGFRLGSKDDSRAPSRPRRGDPGRARVPVPRRQGLEDAHVAGRLAPREGHRGWAARGRARERPLRRDRFLDARGVGARGSRDRLRGRGDGDDLSLVDRRGHGVHPPRLGRPRRVRRERGAREEGAETAGLAARPPARGRVRLPGDAPRGRDAARRARGARTLAGFRAPRRIRGRRPRRDGRGPRRRDLHVRHHGPAEGRRAAELLLDVPGGGRRGDADDRLQRPAVPLASRSRTSSGRCA